MRECKEEEKIPKKKWALSPSERNKICFHVPLHYTGKMPCTGPVMCSMCGTIWNTIEEAKEYREKLKKEYGHLIEDKRKKIVYIAGPYRGKTIQEVKQNILNAELVAIKYWKIGYTVFCPHKNAALFDGILPYKVWLEGGLEILRRCDIIVMMKDWENSEGSDREHKLAKELGKEIFYE